MRSAIFERVRQKLWVFRDPLPFAALAAVLLACYLSWRIPHWLKTLPPTCGWWYAVRHEDYPPELFLSSVLAVVLVVACVISLGARIVNQIRFGKAFTDCYDSTEWKKHRIVERARANLCPACGYDVRRSSLICPECGSAIRRLPNDPPPRLVTRAGRRSARGHPR
ncbi:MAG: hypothetical protein ACRD3S_07385, partial [Terracidiphilus sp.]